MQCIICQSKVKKNGGKMTNVPHSLRVWFVIHFFADILFAIPLLLAPVWILGLFGFQTIDILTTRLVGAALIGIGGASLLHRNASREAYSAMLTVKLLWSGTAIVSFLVAILSGASRSVWLFLVIFSFFFCVWTHYKIKI